MSTYVPDALVIVYSVVDSNSFQKAEEILQYLWRTGSSTNKAVILVGNKSDLVRTRVVSIVGKKQSLLTLPADLFGVMGHFASKMGPKRSGHVTSMMMPRPCPFSSR